MRHLITIAFLLLFATIGFSQPEFNLHFTEETNDGSTYTVNVYLSFTSTAKLASSNFVFNYNTANLSNPTFVTDSTDLTLVPFPVYSVSATEPVTGRVSFNVVLNVSGFGDDITTSTMLLAQITFDVDNPSGSSNLAWIYDGDGATTGTVVFSDDGGNNTTQLNAGTLTNLDTPLPVDLISFTAKKKERTSQLDWLTASEINNLGFDVQRMDANQKWETIGFVEGNGDTDIQHTYSYSDERPIPGTNYYRLKQLDLDGRFEYSNVEAVTFDEDEIKEDWYIYPNPANAYWEIATEEEGVVRMFDVAGSLLIQKQVVAGHARIDIGELASGTYFIRFGREVKKLIVQK